MDPIQSRRLQEAENTLRSLQQQKVDQRIQEMEEEIQAAAERPPTPTRGLQSASSRRSWML